MQNISDSKLPFWKKRILRLKGEESLANKIWILNVIDIINRTKNGNTLVSFLILVSISKILAILMFLPIRHQRLILLVAMP